MVQNRRKQEIDTNTTIFRFALGLVVSVALHAVLVGTSFSFLARSAEEEQQAADELPQLDITSVDLSFAEEENEQAAPSLSQPAAVSPEPPPPPPSQTRLPEPPPLVVPPESDLVTVRRAEEVRPTEFKPRDLEAPESPVEPESSEPQLEQRKPQPRATAASASQPSIPTAAPTQARIDAPPAPRRSIKPKYPEGARKRGEQGDVTLELDVNVHGVVIGVKVTGGCGFAELEQAAVAAARKALFRPAKRDKKPVASRARLTLTFRLKD